MQGGKADILFAEMRRACDVAEAELRVAVPGAAAVLGASALAMRTAVERAEHVTAVLTAESADRCTALSNAHDYLTMLGHTCIGWHWLRAATAASRGLTDVEAEDTDARLFYQGKLHACSFFFRHELPKTEPLARLLLSWDSSVSEMSPGWF